ncbi:MAG: hypothetical protein ABIR79_14925 [Candidatus Binatia bacterium]
MQNLLKVLVAIAAVAAAAVAAAVSVSSVQAQVGLPTPRPGLPDVAAAKDAVKCGKAITKAAIVFASAKLNHDRSVGAARPSRPSRLRRAVRERLQPARLRLR